jgi:hypothetical protein
MLGKKEFIWRWKEFSIQESGACPTDLKMASFKINWSVRRVRIEKMEPLFGKLSGPPD